MRCSAATGFSRIVRQYDDRGNETENAYFGVDGQPVATNDGYSRIVFEYDAHNNQTARTYYGTDGQRIVIAGDRRSRGPPAAPAAPRLTPGSNASTT